METTIKDRLVKLLNDDLALAVPTPLNENASFADDLGLDSLDTVEMIMAVEEEFKLEIPDEIADEWKTMGNLIDYVEKHRG